MTFPHITHHGAVSGVTGSCHQLHADAASSYLVACGLFQGGETSSNGKTGQSSLEIEFPLDTVRALIATHVHIDHVGRIPYLLAAGFKGPILCSEPSAKLLPIVLEDAFKLGVSRDQKQVERYIKLVEQRIIALPYKTWFTLHDSKDLRCRVRLQRAGHILGSAYVRFDITYPATGAQKRIVFSGDLGAPNAPLLRPPVAPERADILVLESTYGDRLHEDRNTRRQRLEAVIEQALQDQGTVLIPAFSIGRTQELLYELEEIIHTKLTNPAHPPIGAGLPANAPHSVEESISAEAASAASSDAQQVVAATNWPELPIILDSPLASRFTAAYRELHLFWNQEARDRLRSGRRPLTFGQLITIDSHADHQRIVNNLSQTARPAIVIAGGGMCGGGRIVNYLKAMLGDKRHNVLFVGYQAKGTPGDAIQNYGPKGGYVDLEGKRIDTRAGITNIGGYRARQRLKQQRREGTMTQADQSLAEFEATLKANAPKLIESLQQGRFDEATQMFNELNQVRNHGLYQEVGKLTRELHNAIVKLEMDTCATGGDPSCGPEKTSRVCDWNAAVSNWNSSCAW